MFKIVSLVALGAAAVSANFLENLRNLQTYTDTNQGFSVPCTYNNASETCSSTPGYCCAKTTKQAYPAGSTPVLLTNSYSCVPAETSGWIWNMTDMNYTVMASCNFATTATTTLNAIKAQNTMCATGCNSTRSYSIMNGTSMMTYGANTNPTYTVCTNLTQGNSYKNNTAWTGTASFAGLTGTI